MYDAPMRSEPSLGHLIRMARLNARLTQRSLGEQLGTNQSSIAAWEAGKVIPGMLKLMAAAKVLDVDVRAFVDAAMVDLEDELAEYPMTV